MDFVCLEGLPEGVYYRVTLLAELHWAGGVVAAACLTYELVLFLLATVTHIIRLARPCDEIEDRSAVSVL